MMMQLLWIQNTEERENLVREDINCILSKLGFISSKFEISAKTSDI